MNILNKSIKEFGELNLNIPLNNKMYGCGECNCPCHIIVGSLDVPKHCIYKINKPIWKEISRYICRGCDKKCVSPIEQINALPAFTFNDNPANYPLPGSECKWEKV